MAFDRDELRVGQCLQRRAHDGPADAENLAASLLEHAEARRGVCAVLGAGAGLAILQGAIDDEHFRRTLRRDLEFVFVRHIGDVFDAAFGRSKPVREPRTRQAPTVSAAIPGSA